MTKGSIQLLMAALLPAAVFLRLPDVALAADEADRCVRKRNDDTVRNIPPSLSARAARALNVEKSDIIEHPERFVYRCMNGAAWVCDHGANITCAKADTRRQTPSVDAFCKSNPDEFVPMFVTGHGAIHSWKCDKGRPVITDSRRVDERGFVAHDWRPLE